MNTIVLGNNHNNTLGLIWSLHEGGHKVTLLLYNEKNNYLSKSTYVDKTYFINEVDDVIGLIKSVAQTMDSKPVVFVSGDKESTLLNEHYSELTDYCFFEGGRPDGSINHWRNKDEGNKLASKCGFTIPQTMVVSTSDEIETLSLEYPIFIKANNSVHGGKSAMRKCETKKKAIEFVNGLEKDNFPLQVQEFIDKEYELMLLGCSLYGGKRVFCPIANRKFRQYPEPAGLVSYSESLAVRHHKELVDLSDKVSLYLKDIEYTGNFSAEFLYKDGVFYFLEINLRNDGTSYLSTASGYNLPDMVCRSFTDENVTDEGCVFTKKYYMNAYADIHYVLDGTVNPIEWIKEYRTAVQSHKNPKDTPPYYQYIRGILKGVLYGVMKKILHLKKKAR